MYGKFSDFWEIVYPLQTFLSPQNISLYPSQSPSLPSTPAKIDLCHRCGSDLSFLEFHVSEIIRCVLCCACFLCSKECFWDFCVIDWFCFILRSIPLYEYTIILYLFMDIWVVSSFWQVQIKLLRTSEHQTNKNKLRRTKVCEGSQPSWSRSQC